MTIPSRIDRPTVGRLARAASLLLLSVFYLPSIFQLTDETFRKTGLGDWMDPYFINYLLEHWRFSVWHLTDPSSPPMFFPARRTLGYSHGLVLYAPFYVVATLFLHPFQAYSVTLLLVLETGIVCLYLVFRKFLALSFVESLALAAFFVTSHNVMNGYIGVWSQRASVFLIPPILLITLMSAQMPMGHPRRVLASLSGLLWALLFIQDFYTAQFALLFVIVGLATVLVAGSGGPEGPPLHARWRLVSEQITSFWKAERSVAAKAALVTGVLASAWTFGVWMFGGGSLQAFGVRFASRDWRRPASIAVAGLLVFGWMTARSGARAVLIRIKPWLLPFALGGLAGSLVFLWIYLPAYLEHRGFPEDQIISSLIQRDASRWQSPVDVIRDLKSYDTMRTFELAVALAILAWLPWLKVNKRARACCLCFLLVSVGVVLIPLRFNDFSIWQVLFQPLPGFSVIRDPKRIIYLYELAAVLATGFIFRQLPKSSVLRMWFPVLLLFFVVTDWNRSVLDFLRPNDAYARWVEAPIAIDPSCRCFFVRAASKEYKDRSEAMWTVYAIDSMFVSLNHSIPTLNGYSAWSPNGWSLTYPESTDYIQAVDRWIERHNLRGVCQFDIEERTMTPYPSKPDDNAR